MAVARRGQERPTLCRASARGATATNDRPAYHRLPALLGTSATLPPGSKSKRRIGNRHKSNNCRRWCCQATTRDENVVVRRTSVDDDVRLARFVDVDCDEALRFALCFGARIGGGGNGVDNELVRCFFDGGVRNGDEPIRL